MYPQVVSQAPQHLSSSETLAICNGCVCPPVCSVIFAPLTLKAIKHYVFKRDVICDFMFELTTLQKKKTPEWTAPFNQSELQTGLGCNRLSLLCSSCSSSSSSSSSVLLTSRKTVQTIRDGEPRTSTSSFTQLLSSELCSDDVGA